MDDAAVLALGICAAPLAAAGIVTATAFFANEQWRRKKARLLRARIVAEIGAALARKERARVIRVRPHCPACGRFSKPGGTTRAGEYTVCAVHGHRLRPAIVTLVFVQSAVLLEVPAVTSPLTVQAPVPAPLGLPR